MHAECLLRFKIEDSARFHDELVADDLKRVRGLGQSEGQCRRLTGIGICARQEADDGTRFRILGDRERRRIGIRIGARQETDDAPRRFILGDRGRRKSNRGRRFIHIVKVDREDLGLAEATGIGGRHVHADSLVRLKIKDRARLHDELVANDLKRVRGFS